MAKGIKGIKLIDIDRGFAALKKDLKDLRGSYVKVGLMGTKAAEPHPDEEGKSGPVTNVDLAVIHEFGAPGAGIPARPFVSGSYTKHSKEYEDLLTKGMAKVYERKMTVAKMLGLIGAKAASDMKQYVTQGASPFEPNSPSTFKRKLEKSYAGAREKEGPLGAPRPLIDTGRMIGAITWSVKLGSSAEKEGDVSTTEPGSAAITTHTEGGEE